MDVHIVPKPVGERKSSGNGRPDTTFVELPQIDWDVMIPRLKYYGWLVFTKLALGIVYMSIIRDGLRFVLPSLATKLSRIPGLNFLNDFELGYQLDMAVPMALFVLLAVFWLWDRALNMWLTGEDIPLNGTNRLPLFRVRSELFVYGMAFVVLSADSVLFYISIVRSNWGGSPISFTAMLATVLYAAVLIFVTLVALELRLQLIMALEERRFRLERNEL